MSLILSGEAYMYNVYSRSLFCLRDPGILGEDCLGDSGPSSPRGVVCTHLGLPTPHPKYPLIMTLKRGASLKYMHFT